MEVDSVRSKVYVYNMDVQYLLFLGVDSVGDEVELDRNTVYVNMFCFLVVWQCQYEVEIDRITVYAYMSYF